MNRRVVSHARRGNRGQVGHVVTFMAYLIGEADWTTEKRSILSGALVVLVFAIAVGYLAGSTGSVS
jgi:hypothetical protein